MVGELYGDEDNRRTAGFSIFYLGINIGSLFSPFIVGWLCDHYGFHAGFSAAAVGKPALKRLGSAVVVLLLLAVSVSALLHGGLGIQSVIDTISYVWLAVPIGFFFVMLRSPRVTAPERRRVLAYIPLFIAAMFFWMIFEQASSTMTTFAANRTDLDFFGVGIRPEFFQSVNPAAIICLTPLFALLWQRLGEHGLALGYKFSIGLFLAGFSFVIMAAASYLTDGKASSLWLVGAYVVQSVGELCLSPVGLAATTLLAPLAFRNQTMALWLLSSAAGQAITAQTISATAGVSDTAYFDGLAAVAIVASFVLVGLTP